MRTPHPDDVMLSLGHVTTPDGPRVSLSADAADTDRRLMTLDLSPREFALLIGARVVTVRSQTPLDPPPAVQPEPVPVPAYPAVGWLNVTLHGTTNQYLQLPCAGQLQVNEYGTDGSIINATFRVRHPDGSLSAPVHVPHPRFTYAHGPASAPTLHALPTTGICGVAGTNGWRCGMWDHVAHSVHVYTVPPPAIALIPVAEADSPEQARTLSGVPFPYLGVWRAQSGDPAALLHVFSAEPPSVMRIQGYIPAGVNAGA